MTLPRLLLRLAVAAVVIAAAISAGQAAAHKRTIDLGDGPDLAMDQVNPCAPFLLNLLRFYFPTWAVLTECPTPPEAPTLSAYTAASGSVRLLWDAGKGLVSRWEYRQRQDGEDWGEWQRIVGADATTEHRVIGLTPDGHYEFQLRGGNAGGNGPPSVSVSAAAGQTPSEPITYLLYDKNDATGGATAPGAHALLSDASDYSSGITNLEDAPTVTALLINVEGFGGRHYADFLANVEPGDTFTWWRGPTCWFAFRVDFVPPSPPLLGRYVFALKLTNAEPCAGQIPNPKPGGFHQLNWGTPPTEPLVGLDGIRMFPDNYPVAGGHTYRLTEDGYGISRVVIDVPADMRLIQTGASEDFGGSTTVFFKDEASGGTLALDYDDGEEVGRHVPVNQSESRDVGALFDAIAASARIQPQP